MQSIKHTSRLGRGRDGRRRLPGAQQRDRAGELRVGAGAGTLGGLAVAHAGRGVVGCFAIGHKILRRDADAVNLIFVRRDPVRDGDARVAAVAKRVNILH